MGFINKMMNKKGEEQQIPMPLMENLHIKIFFVVIILCVFGCLMVYSASSNMCAQKEIYEYDSMYMLKRQAFFIAIGLIIMFVGLFYNLAKMVRHLTVVFYFAALACIGLLTTPLGVSSHGATRWLRIFGIQFQVAEIVKIGVIAAMAGLVIHFHKHLKKWQLTVLMWGIGGFVAILLYGISNDLSSSVVVLGIIFGITFVTHKTVKLHAAVFFLAVGGVGSYILYIKNNLPTQDELAQASFRLGRIAAWLSPESYSSDQAYQTLNSLYAIGSGGVFGKGIGMSLMKLGPIPESQNDMIFAIIVEELGMVGGGVLIFLYLYLLYLMFRVMKKVSDLFEFILVLGVFLHVGIQSFFNIGVALNVLPNTGIGLPFISYGGTAVFCLLCEMALVCSIARRSYMRSVRNEVRRYKELWGE